MALVLDQFLEKYGIKSSAHLQNARIVRQDRMPWFRMSIIHYLDIDSASKFPNRNMYQLREMDKSKKIPVHHLSDMLYHEGTGPVIDRYIPNQVKKWSTTHVKTFRTKDLIEDPTKDIHIASIVNHNPYKDKYGYVSARTEFVNMHYNYLKTFADTLTKHVKGRPDFYHVVSIKIPPIIPGFKAMLKLMTYNEARLGLVVDDPHLFWYFELYKWNSTKFRSKSVFKNISDTDAKSIIIEFKSKGYSCFVPLYVLRGLSKDSSLPSNLKMEDLKSTKLLTLLLLRIQSSIEEAAAGAAEIKMSLQDDADPEGYRDEDSEVEENMNLDEDGEEITERDVGSEPGPITDNEELDVNSFANKRKNRLKPKPLSTDDKQDDFVINGVANDSFLDDIDSLDDMSAELFNLVNEDIVIDKPKKKKKPEFKEVSIEQEEKEKDEEEEKESSHTKEEADAEEMNLFKPMDLEERSMLLKTQRQSDIIESHIKNGQSSGAITSSEIKSLRTKMEKRVRLKDPYTLELLDAVIQAKSSNTKINAETARMDLDNKFVPESFKVNKIKEFDKAYQKHNLKKDIVSCVSHIENAGIIITDYQIEDVQSVTDNYEIHRVSIAPIKGKASTWYFKLPKVDDQGTFMSNGVHYRLRKQEQELPIRKVGPDKVSLQSNSGKLFINRTSRAAYSRTRYIDNFIRESYMSGEGLIRDFVPGSKALNLEKHLPNDYFAIASEFDMIETESVKFILKQEEKEKILKADLIKELDGQADKFIFVGIKKSTNEILVMDYDGYVYNYSTNEELGSMTSLLGISSDKIPKSFSSIMIIGDELPLGVAMSYYLGLSNMIRLMNVKYEIYPKNVRATMSPDNPKDEVLTLRFFDYKVCLLLDTEEKKLLFNGFTWFKDFTKNYKVSSFDNKNIYLNMIQTRGMDAHHLKDLDSQDQLFIDPITRDVLEEIGEPTEFKELLLRANELLTDYKHPDVNDPHFVRIRGYDRVPGLAYRVIAKAIRDHNRSGSTNTPIALDRYAIWNTIVQDNSIKSRDVINPILTLKEDTIVTLTGVDGLRSDAVPVQLRRYHKNDIGLISEGTVDSKNVALASYASPYMNVTDVRGLVNKDKSEFTKDPSKIMSGPIQISPFSEYDDQIGSP